MPVYRLAGVVPAIHPDAYVHPDAVLIGDVEIGARANVWPGAVLRGDFGRIRVGEGSSVQDNSTIHAGAETPTLIGSECVIGHRVHMEGTVVEDGVLIGSGAVVLAATVRTGGCVAAGAVVLDGVEVRAGFRAQGIPAVNVSSGLSDSEVRGWARQYGQMADRYRTSASPADA